MPFGRRILDRRRVVLAVKQKGASAPAIVDPSVDLKAKKTNLDAYRESHWDCKHLGLREDDRPTYWTIEGLSRKQVRWGRTLGEDSSEFYDFVTRAGLKLVDNYILEKEGGERVPMPAVEVEKSGDLGELITDKWMDTVNLQSNIKVGLAIMIWQISEVHLPLPSASEPQSGG